MSAILSAIDTLDQHLSTYLHNPSAYKPAQCPGCSSHRLWSHGTYERKARCENGHRCPILIPRYICALCKHTCSTLPEFIPPRRWYHWAIQQMALSLLLLGHSVLSVWARLFDRAPCGPSPSTLQRWRQALKARYPRHRLALCSALPTLGYTSGFTDFWQACLQKLPLSSAMVIIHRSAIPIP